MEAPPFFVPSAKPDRQEEAYAGFAKWCGRAVPQRTDRVYSITFAHDGEEWTATVGQALHGVRRRYSRKGGSRTERVIGLRDPATVLAIFPGYPYLVVTNHGLAPNVGSAWVNPFMAGQPSSVTHFSANTSDG